MRRSDDSFTVTAGKPAYRGRCLARIGGKVIFIKGLLPGESARVRITDEKNDYSVAVVEEILCQSTERVTPLCRFYGSCGGCHYQHASYAAQLALKEAILADTFARIARSEVTLSASLPSPLPWGYRHRAQFKLSPAGIGFFREGSRDVVPVDRCPLMTAGINAALEGIQGLFGRMPALFRGISEICLCHGDRTTALLRVRHDAADEGAARRLCAELLDLGVAGAALSSPGGRMALFGAGTSTLILGNLSYAVSPAAFFQANWTLNELLSAHIAERLSPLEGRTVLDLYAGSGNFSLALASAANAVIAVEEDVTSAKILRENVLINALRNVQCVNLPAESFRPDRSFDAVILDPPRPGLTRKVRESLLAWSPERIVYVSCNPSTMARDIAALLRSYEMESLRMIDFFPQTYHLEAVAFLRRRE